MFGHSVLAASYPNLQVDLVMSLTVVGQLFSVISLWKVMQVRALFCRDWHELDFLGITWI
jgi:hypothetical protein